MKVKDYEANFNADDFTIFRYNLYQVLKRNCADLVRRFVSERRTYIEFERIIEQNI